MKGFCRSTTATETAIGGILAIAGDRFRFQVWWWLYFLRRERKRARDGKELQAIAIFRHPKSSVPEEVLLNKEEGIRKKEEGRGGD
jgi:hypothetical protein